MRIGTKTRCFDPGDRDHRKAVADREGGGVSLARGIVCAAQALSVDHLTPIALGPVDGVEITILVDNLTDVFMPDEGPARRFPVTSPSAPRQAASTLKGREVVEQLRGEHGFSALVTLTVGGRTRRVLFDTGVSPDGLVHNMRFLELAPGDVEAIVLSHGHFDHTTGLDGSSAPSGGPTSRSSSIRSSGVVADSCCRDANRGSCPPPAGQRSKGSDSRSSRSDSRHFSSTAACS